MKITIIDYGLSNLLSVNRAFQFLGEETEVVNTPEAIRAAEGLVLPGVGAFRNGMERLERLGLVDVIGERVKTGVPFLGICLGMQMLFEESDENGLHYGLGFIKGRVELIPFKDINGEKQMVPHVSWNPLYPSNGNKFHNRLLKNIEIGDEVYFVHSYEAKVQNKEDCIAITKYGGRDICAAVANKNIYGCQFHPEKSGEVGLNILSAFIKNVRNRGKEL